MENVKFIGAVLVDKRKTTYSVNITKSVTIALIGEQIQIQH